MAQHGTDAGDDSQILNLFRRDRKQLNHEIREPGARGESLESVRHEHEAAGGYAENAKGIGRADVAAANGADVNSPGAGDQIAGRD